LGGRDEVNSESDIVKNSLVGSAKKNVQDSLGDKEAKDSMPKKVKEMTATPQNSAGVKKMKMPGAEKKIKLKEGLSLAELLNENDEEDNDLFNTREKAENIAKQRSHFNKNEIYYVEEENGKYKAVESIYDEPPRGVYFQNGNRKGGSYMPSPGNDPGNVDESKLVSLIRTMVRESLNEGANDWDTLFNWLKQFSTDKGEFLSKNNISSGIFLEKKLTSGEVKVEDLDKIAKKDGTVFSKLPVYNRIK
jgi:hypothetical protein